MCAAPRIFEMSFGTAFLIEASAEPVISQDEITSQSAVLCLRRKAFFFGYGLWRCVFVHGGKHFPEAVLRVAVVELLLARLYRRESAQNENARILVENRLERVNHAMILAEL